MSFTSFQTEFDKMMSRDYFSDKVHPMREEAFSKFIEMGLPTKKWEEWQFTNFSKFKNNQFRLSSVTYIHLLPRTCNFF